MDDRIARNEPSSYWECLGMSSFGGCALASPNWLAARKSLKGLVRRNDSTYFGRCYRERHAQLCIDGIRGANEQEESRYGL